MATQHAGWMAFLLAIAPPLSAQDAKPAPVSAKMLAADTIPPTLNAAATEITKLTGISFTIPPGVGDHTTATKLAGPFWTVVEKLAAESKCRFRVQGGKLLFAPLPPGGVPAPSSIDGPFRVSVRQVVSRRDPESGTAFTEIHLDIAWEPRFPVYLLDAEPRIDAAKTATATYQADAPTGRVSPGGFSHSAVVRIKGIPREERKIDLLSGSLTVIAAEKLLAVEFKNLTGTAAVTQTVEGVGVTLKPAKAANGLLELPFALDYPAGHPEFESFQSWAGANKLRLYDAAGKAFEPGDYNTSETGHRIGASYFFPAPKGLPDLKGWRAVYETPCPMVEQKVTFTLKDIPLP